MDMIPVQSTDLAAVGYEAGTLYIRFRRGGTYCYYNVPESAFHSLLHAPSKGKYFHTFIKNQYRCNRF